MRNGNQTAIALGGAGLVVLIAVVAIYAPSLLSFLIPVSVFVFLGLYGRRKQRQLEQQRQAAAAQFPSPPAPEVRHVPPRPQVQQDQPVRQGLQGPVPPNPWWQSQAFPTSQPPPAPVAPSPPPPPVRAAEPGQVTVAPELHARVEELRKTGKTVEAIDLLREETGMELYPASRYVLAIEAP